MPRTENARHWAWVSRPEGSGRPAVRAMSASRERSWTWFRADAPHERSMTPASTNRPCAHGNSGPSGARSMKPAPAETSTSSTMPNFESSMYALKRAATPRAGSPRGDAAAALGMGDPPRGARGAGRPPAAGLDAGPHQRGPEGITDRGVRGPDGRGQLQQHGDRPEGDLDHEQDREEPREPSQPGRRGPPQRHHARGQDQPGRGQGGEAVAVLDEHVGPQRRDHRAVAEGPVRAREARAG